MTGPINRNRPTGLYKLFDGNGVLLYVGIGFVPERRWASHARTKPWWRSVASKHVEWHPNRGLARAAEREAIQTLKPLHNISEMPSGSPPTKEAMAARRAAEASKARWRVVEERVVARWNRGRTPAQIAHYEKITTMQVRKILQSRGISRTIR